MLNERASRIALFFAAVALFADYGFAQLVVQESKWDRALPSMELTYVSFDGTSMANAWQNMSSELGLRTILFIGKEDHGSEGISKRPFSYSTEKGTARDVLDSFSSHYGYQWAHDEKTGVIWIFPETYEYESIMTAQVEVPRDMRAVPMQSGILSGLGRDLESGIEIQMLGGRSTYDYGVNVPAGVYTYRDLLNVSCVANPIGHFIVYEDLGYGPRDSVVPLITISYKMKGRIPAARLFWDIEMLPRTGSEYSEESLRAALSSPDEDLRRTARNYLHTSDFTAGVSGFLSIMTSPTASETEKIWTAIGYVSTMMNDYDHGGATPTEIMEFFDDLLTRDFLMNADPQLALLCALADYAGNSVYTSEAPLLEIISNRSFTADQLSGIEDDVAHLALRLPIIFTVLTDKKNSRYIDTSGWAQSFLGNTFEESRYFYFLEPESESSDESSSWVLPLIVVLVGSLAMLAVTMTVDWRKSRQT